MKLIHTSDLHLGATWRGISRRNDQQRVLEEILSLCDTHNVDALLITGDVFSDRVEGGKPATVARRFLEQLRPHLARGRAVILLRGNHDPLDLFMLMRVLVSDMSKGAKWPLVIADLPEVYLVPGHNLQIVALPYVTASHLREQAVAFATSPDREIPTLAGIFAQSVRLLYEQASSNVPAILAAHMMVKGAQLTEDRMVEPGYNNELWLEPGMLPYFTSYNALGHIHLGQKVTGTEKPTWYAGAPDRMDLGERDYVPQVLLVETPEEPGGVAKVQQLPLSSCTPFRQETLSGMDAVSRLCEALSAAVGSDALGEVLISGVDVTSRSLVIDRIHTVSPRLQIHWTHETAASLTTAVEEDPHNVPATLASYLERVYAPQPERRTQLMNAFTSLWNEMSEVGQ